MTQARSLRKCPLLTAQFQPTVWSSKLAGCSVAFRTYSADRGQESTRPHVAHHRINTGSGSSGRMLKDVVPSWDRMVPWERSSLIAPQELPDEAIDMFIEDEIARFAPMRPRPLSMKEVLDMLDPQRIAKFLHVEVPIRFAERIRWIEEIPSWEHVPELADIHRKHVGVFRELRLVQRRPNLDAFTNAVQGALASQRDVHYVLALAMHRLNEERGSDYGSNFADQWLDKFLLNCIGTEALMSQYVACERIQAHANGSHGTVVRRGRDFAAGIVDPECDVPQICRETAEHVVEMCEEHTGCAPLVKVEVHTARASPRFAYIPGFLRFMIREILKNSCRATAELVGKSEKKASERPINMIVCGDDHHVAIRVIDRAQGIPFNVGSQVWSYLYSTTGKGVAYGKHATTLAGYGCGLPLSRLYARYLGGSLDLVSLPGYGTSVDIFLTRLDSEQVEVVPDEDLVV